MTVPDLSHAKPGHPVRVGRYDVLRLLGQGGMGTVYEAVDVEHGTRVALKTLKHLDAASLLLFKREFRRVADLSHPNLVSLYELSGHDGLWFFTMEHVEGRNFVTWLGDRSPSAERGGQTGSTLAETATEYRSSGAVRFEDTDAGEPVQLDPAAIERLRGSLSQLVQGVRALHGAGILHLDIKPSNVLVDLRGRVVLLDFGVSHAVGDDDPGGPRRVVGTPAWMSPEQHDGEPVSEASDWYSVGLVLYAALTGMRAFRADNAYALSYAKRYAPPVPPAQLVDVPADLSELAMALIQPAPRRRPTEAAILARVAADPDERALSLRRNSDIVGRETQQTQLRAAFSHIVDGGSSVVQLRGPSGVGKSALLRDLREHASRGDTIVLRGRCYERESVPYKAFDDMLDDLARQLAKRPIPEVQACLPPSLEELTRVFPVLAGVQAIDERLQQMMPPLRSLPAAVVQGRAIEALRALFANLAARRRCLIEIDDLQWADADSARALARLLAAPVPPGLLVALSYRSVEAAENDPVTRTLRAIADTDVDAPTPDRITLEVGPLADEDARALARACLGRDDLPSGLLESIAHVAAGVPFFVEELAHLASHQLDRGELPNVDLHDVIARRVEALVEEERAVVETLAVANSPVPLSVAVSVAGIEDRGVMRALWSLRRHDFVRSTGVSPGDTVELRHDRLRESVVVLLDAERLDDLHLALGRALADLGGRASTESPWLFDAVRHLNAVRERLDDHERVTAARLNLDAGRRARRSAAFALAFACFDAGTMLLGPRGWEREYELMLALHDGAADAAYLSATWHAVARHVDAIKKNARTVTDQLGAWEAEIDASIARSEYDAAVDAGREALSRMDVELPPNPGSAEIGAEFQTATLALAEVGPEGVGDLPLATDPLKMAAMRLQSRITSAAYFARPNLLPLLACRMVTASVRDGLAPATPYALSIYGIVLNTLGMHAQAHAWGQVALTLMERFEDRSLDARTGHVVHDLVCNWTVPLAGTLPDVLAVYEAGKSSGDVEYAAYAAHAYVHNAIYAGQELEGLLQQAIEFGDFMRGHDQVNALHVHEPFEQLLRAFTGRTSDPARLDGEGFLESVSLAAAEAAGSRSAMCLNRVVMGIARYNLGTPEQASEMFEAARPYLDGMPSVWHTPIFHQYAALAILGLRDEARTPLMGHVDTSLEALRALAVAGPMNFAHRVELIEAERARVEGDLDAALEHCSRAIASAREHGWPNDLGIALQISGRCHRARGDGDQAARALHEAAEAFSGWGASAKAAQLR